MADLFTKACFIAGGEGEQLWAIYDVIAGGGGISDNVNVTNTCLSVQPCEGAVFEVSGEVTVTGLPALGQALMAASLPVVIASDQTAIPVTISSSGVQDAIARAAVVADTVIAAGHKCITIFTSNDWVGTVAAVTFPASATETYPAPSGNTLGSLAIVRTAGTLYYSTVG